MRSNVKLGTISGIEIGLHYSWFIIAALIAFSLAEHFRQVNPGLGPGQIWIAALVTAALFFTTLLLHELAHSLVAQARGLKVRAITLFALGGVSQIQDDATDAKTELLVAIAGPIASLIIGFGCLGIALGLGLATFHRTADCGSWGSGVVGVYQLALAVFNMIPGFPLDGGRCCARSFGQLPKTLIAPPASPHASGNSSLFCSFSMGYGDFFPARALAACGSHSLAGFLMDAAKASYADVEITTALRGIRVSEVMSRDCSIVSPRMSLQEFVNTYLLRAGERCFAVEEQGRFGASLPPAMWAAYRATVGTRPLCGKQCARCRSCISSRPRRPFWMR